MTLMERKRPPCVWLSYNTPNPGDHNQSLKCIQLLVIRIRGWRKVYSCGRGAGLCEPHIGISPNTSTHPYIF